jgi:hypothetical protein
MRRAVWTAGCLALAACGRGEPAPAGDAPIAPVASAAPAGEGEAAWVVTAGGAGPVRVGGDASALGARVSVEGAGGTVETCQYVRPPGAPPGVGVMVVDGRVARVDVDSGRVATAEGVRVGDPEARVRSLYAGRVREQPHKYTRGRYLVVTPAGAPDGRIVFETDGSAVTRYRAGRIPEVEWVERCG